MIMCHCIGFYTAIVESSHHCTLFELVHCGASSGPVYSGLIHSVLYTRVYTYTAQRGNKTALLREAWPLVSTR